MTDSPQTIITCLVPGGISRAVIKTLKEKLGIISSSFKLARGIGKRSPLALRGIGEQTEKEVLNVIVPTEQADEVFAFLFEEAQINRPHGGLIYSHPLQRATTYTLPDIPEDCSKHT